MNHSGGRFHGDARPGRPPHVRTRAQLREIGLTRTDITASLDRGWLVREKHGTYALTVTELRLRMELVLVRSPEAVFSHRTAAHAHRLKARLPDELEVIVPRSRRSPRGARGHSRRHVQAVVIDGIAFTTVAQTLSDLLDIWPHRAVAETIDDHFPTMSSRSAVLADARRLPARQANRLLALLEWAPENRRSKIEGHLARALQMRGLTVRLNVRIRPYVWDIYIVEANLVVEFDSMKFHANEDVFRVDRARQNNLVRRDVRILRYADYDLAHRFRDVVDEICDEVAHALGSPRTASRWDTTHCRDIYLNLERESDWRPR